MNRRQARRLYLQHASAMAYVDVERPNGDRGIGAAFHIGEGIFVTARHLVEDNRIVEVKVTEPLSISTEEFLRNEMKADVTDEYIKSYEDRVKSADGAPALWKHFLRPLALAKGPVFPEEGDLDVAIFQVAEMHPGASIVKLGIHWDDWINRGLWHLSDAIVLGYPPVPMVNEPVLVAARAEILTYVIPRHVQAVHFLLSATPRGGFSGGVAIQENGDALGLITTSLVENDAPEQLGFLAVLSVEAIVKCCARSRMYPKVQRSYQSSLMKIDPQDYDNYIEGMYPSSVDRSA